MPQGSEKILKVDNTNEEKFLRSKTLSCTFEPDGSIKFGDKLLSKREVNDLIMEMKRKMRDANGVGLSANQIGLPYRLFVASVPDHDGNMKFYAVFNPEIEKKDSEEIEIEEGCLSVPGIYGIVARSRKVVLVGFDKGGKVLKIKAWDLLARVFQHEVDHLNGHLFIDKAKNLEKSESTI